MMRWLLILLLLMAVGLVGCGEPEERTFVGTLGGERVEIKIIDKGRNKITSVTYGEIELMEDK